MYKGQYRELKQLNPSGYGVRIDLLCKKNNIGYSELAKALNVNRKTIYSVIEGGNCKANLMISIADLFSVSLDWLVYGKKFKERGKEK